MANEPKVDRAGGDYQRGPNPKPGGEIDTGNSAVPPYDERSTGAEDRPGTARAFDTEMPAAEPVSPGSDVTPDDAGTPPPGVGESTTRRGEDVIKQEGKEAGRQDTGTTDSPARRPTGESGGRDATAIDHEKADRNPPS